MSKTHTFILRKLWKHYGDETVCRMQIMSGFEGLGMTGHELKIMVAWIEHSGRPSMSRNEKNNWTGEKAVMEIEG